MRDRPGLCITVSAPTTRELRARRDAAAGADLVELRLDSVSDPDVPGALAGRATPVLVTCRPTWEGGGFRGSEEERRRMLATALDLGADYVDMEWRAGFADLIDRRAGRGVVLSMHDFDAVPADLDDRYRAMRATGAEVVKLAVRATRLCDTVSLLDIGRRAAEGERAVLVGMGPAGLATRVLAARLGSCWTYAGWEPGVSQIDPARLLREFRFKSIGPRTAVYGLAGRPAMHSLSPAMHNGGFDVYGIDAVYVPLEAQDADDFVGFARAVSLQGASVTAPFKRDLLRVVDEADDLSRRVGALNTIKVEDGRWLGRNTDVAGFLAPLRARLSLSGVRASVLGAGGAARATAVALASEGARVSIHARRMAAAAEAARCAGAAASSWPPEPGSWDVLVNATPIGTYPRERESPMAGKALDGRLVYDLVYNPAKTRLLADAEAAGCDTVNGLPMLIEQARLQFEWWTGRCPGQSRFATAALQRLEELRTELAWEATR